jgi:hypothetical protein
VKIYIAFFACFLVTKSALACDPVEQGILSSLNDRIRTSLKIDETVPYVDFETLLPVCKSWHQKNGYAIVTKPYVYTAKSDGLTYLGMFIAVLDKANGKMIGFINENKIMVADALEPDRITIDTANYKVKEGTVAFGVRTMRRNNSEAVPRQDEFLNLYILDQNRIKKIINSMVSESYQGEGVRDCEFVTREKNTSISVSRNSTKGFFDLLARVKGIHTKLVQIGTSCKKVSKPSKAIDYTLKFNGDTYELPEALQAHVD